MTEKETILKAISSRLPYQVYAEKLEIEFTIWSDLEMVELNNLYEVETLLPGYYGLGSNGESELLAIDLKTGVFYSIPFSSMKKSEKKVVAESFKKLLEMEV